MANKTTIRAGVIPYFIDKNGKVKFVLITPKCVKNYWIVPKGRIEKELGKKRSALMEAHEEAGAKGKIIKKFRETYTYSKNGEEFLVYLYLMKVDELADSWQEENVRQRTVVIKKKALSLIQNKSLQKAIFSATEYINQS